MEVNFSQVAQQTQLQQVEPANNDGLDKQPNNNVLNNVNVKAVEGAADKVVSSNEIETAIAEINEFVQTQNRQLNFSFDESNQRSIIKVTESESGDVIRQIPSEEVLKLSERLKELQTDVGAAVGVLFNKEV